MTTPPKLRIALVGCGQIADAHLQELRKIPLADVVAVCDRQIDLAHQAAARFEVPATFDDMLRMIETARPDVIHITTPPASHRPLALQAIERGCHVYVEKPFTIDTAECDEVLAAAAAKGVYVCVGHDNLFDPVWLEFRKLYDSGDIGRAVHIDSLQGYDLRGPFGNALRNDPDHWVHRLPGGLFQNVVSHAFYRITDLLPDAQPTFDAFWSSGTSGMPFPTELRVMLRGAETTAHLLFSCETRALFRHVRVLGRKAAVDVDFDGQTLLVHRGSSARGPFAKIDMPWRQARGAWRQFTKNVKRFIRSDIHFFAGMNRLFTLFYQSILARSTPPIRPEEIRRVTALLDDIFIHCRNTANVSRKEEVAR